MGETGLDHFRDYAPRDRQAVLFRHRRRSRARPARRSSSIRVPQTTRLSPCSRPAAGGDRRPALLLLPGLLGPALEHGWYCSFAGNVTYPKAETSLAAAARSGRPDPRRDRYPVLSPQAVRGKRNEPAHVLHSRGSPRREERSGPSSSARSRRTQPPRSGCHERVRSRARPALPRRPEHPRRRRTPRRARPRRRRAGGGPWPRRPDGLSRRPRRARPRRRARPLAEAQLRGARGALQRRARGSGTPWRSLDALDPPPAKLVANLPYYIATPLLVESLDGLPSSSAGRSWCSGRSPTASSRSGRGPTAPPRCSCG